MVEAKDEGIMVVKRLNVVEDRKIDIRTLIAGRNRYYFVKRCFDIAVSFLVIVLLLSWLLPLVALAICIESRGPVFFCQRRVGSFGRSFMCIKLRTMYVNADADVLQARYHDVRITKLGRFLRISNLDELPQFINVLLGQMSIVGPRPHMHKDCATFAEVVQYYKLRTVMKPGITGLAQVKGFRGPTDSCDKVFKRYQWDAFYIRNADFWMDIRIVHETAMQTFKILTRHMRVSTEVPKKVEVA